VSNLRVLLLSNMGPSKNKPNSGRFVFNQYESLKKQGNCHVDFYYLDQEEKSGIAKLLRYPLFFLRFVLGYIFSFKKYDIIHVHFYFPNILFAIAYKLLRNWRAKIVVTFHGSDIYLYPTPGPVYRFSSGFVDKFIFVSEKLKQRFFKPVSASVLSAGVNDLFYEPQTTAIKQFDFVFVGNLNKNKGIDRLEAILENFQRKLTVAIVGSGDSSFIERLAKNENVSIRYFDYCSAQQLVTIYNESYMLINLSYNESFGLVMAEAMACGLPVIATQTDGSTAQVLNGENGFLIPNDENVCVNATSAIEQVLDLTEQDYLTMRLCAINSAAPYQLSSVTEEILKIYAKLRVDNE